MLHVNLSSPRSKNVTQSWLYTELKELQESDPGALVSWIKEGVEGEKSEKHL